MFARLASFVALSLPLLAAATAVPRNNADEVCPTNTGSLECCNSVQDASSYDAQQILTSATGLAIQALVGTITGNVGLTCNPVVGVITSTSCTQQAACCTNNEFNSLISIACTPVNLVV